jgi:hypothetical protein
MFFGEGNPIQVLSPCFICATGERYEQTKIRRSRALMAEEQIATVSGSAVQADARKPVGQELSHVASEYIIHGQNTTRSR